MLIPFPNVPIALGVPPIARLIGALVADPIAVTADVLLGTSLSQIPPWGIFDKAGLPLLASDNVMGVDFRKEWRVSTAPLERGAFSSYNKVEEPFDAKVTFSIGSSVADRSALLLALQTAASSLSLYTVVTPEVTYPNACIVHYDYRRRSSQGAALIIIDVWVEEIRETAGAAFTKADTPTDADTSNAQNPSASPDKNGGTVQSTSAPPVPDAPAATAANPAMAY